MSQLEYLIVLVSIILGVGLADLAESLRDLVRPRQRVRWHWLPLTWVVIVLMKVLGAWWLFFQVLQAEVWEYPIMFMLLLLTALSLYLLCAFALPDLDWEKRRSPGEEASSSDATLDLEAFYYSASHRRWFFGVAIVVMVLLSLNRSIEEVTRGSRNVTSEVVDFFLATLLFGAPYSIGIVTQRRWVHVLLAVVGLGLGLFLLLEVPTLSGVHLL